MPSAESELNLQVRQTSDQYGRGTGYFVLKLTYAALEAQGANTTQDSMVTVLVVLVLMMVIVVVLVVAVMMWS